MTKSPAPTYEAFLAQAKALARANDDALYYLLLDVEPMTSVWSGHYATWSSLLWGEGLGNEGTYEAVKAIVKQCGRVGAEVLGVPACQVLVHLTHTGRVAGINRLIAWVEAHHGRQPTKAEAASLLAKDPRVETLEALRQRVRRLESLLAAHDVAIPDFPEAGTPAGTALDAAGALVRARVKMESHFQGISDENALRVARSLMDASSNDLAAILRRERRTVRKAIPAPPTPAVVTEGPVLVRTVRGDVPIAEAILQCLRVPDTEEGVTLQFRAEGWTLLGTKSSIEEAVHEAIALDPTRFPVVLPEVFETKATPPPTPVISESAEAGIARFVAERVRKLEGSNVVVTDEWTRSSRIYQAYREWAKGQPSVQTVWHPVFGPWLRKALGVEPVNLNSSLYYPARLL
jgi:hypothetical protein